MTVTEGTDSAVRNPWIQVAVLGGDVSTIDFQEGLTVGQALEQAGVQVANGQVVTLNGAPVQDMDQTLEADSVLNVVGRVRNG